MLELNRIYNEDCLEGMKKIDDKSVDFILADFPFNCQDGRKNYEEFVKDCSTNFLRVSKDVCNLLIINCPAKIFTTSKYFQDWTLVNEIALIRRGSLRAAYHYGFQHNTCLILNRGGIKNKWNGTKQNHDKQFHTDVMTYQNGYRGKGKTWHPQAIQLQFTEEFIKTLTNENDIILDPFMGSGTTAIACMNTNRKFIGFELNKEYFDISNRRIEETYNNQNIMF